MALEVGFNVGAMKKTSVLATLVFGCLIVLANNVFAQAVDTDGDGVNDYLETKDGTDPDNATSFNTLSRGLVAYYPFDGNANDESGNQNNLNLLKAVLGSDRFGGASSAMLNQSGTGVVATSTKAISITGNSPRTITFWAKIPNLNNSDSLGVGWGTNQNIGNGSQLSVFGDGRAYFWGSWADVQSEYSTLQKEQWAHLSFTYSGSFPTAQFFVDGLPREVVGSGIWDLQLDTKTTVLKIAAWTMQDGIQTLSGVLIDDIRIYNRALSAQEVADLYQAESDPDWDKDGLVASIEDEIGTNPRNPDTDGDGLKDGAEYLLADLGFDPLSVNTDLVRNLFIPSYLPSVDISAPAGTPMRASLLSNDAEIYSAVSLPPGWDYDIATEQISGRLTGTNSVSAQFIARLGTNTPSPFIFNFYPQSGQTIAAFGRIPTQTFSYTPLTIVPLPTSSSGLPVVLSVKSGPATLTASNQVTFTGVGTVVLAANQAGNTSISAAPEVITSFLVSKGPQSINFPELTSVPFVSGNTFQIAATSSSDLPVTFRSSNTRVLTISGSTATIVGRGKATITATQAGDARWSAARAVTRTITVF